MECSRTLIAYVVVGVVVVGAKTVLKVIPRESYCGRLLISRNFGDSSVNLPVNVNFLASSESNIVIRYKNSWFVYWTIINQRIFKSYLINEFFNE